MREASTCINMFINHINLCIDEHYHKFWRPKDNYEYVYENLHLAEETTFRKLSKLILIREEFNLRRPFNDWSTKKIRESLSLASDSQIFLPPNPSTITFIPSEIGVCLSWLPSVEYLASLMICLTRTLARYHPEANFILGLRLIRSIVPVNTTSASVKRLSRGFKNSRRQIWRCLWERFFFFDTFGLSLLASVLASDEIIFTRASCEWG